MRFLARWMMRVYILGSAASASVKVLDANDYLKRCVRQSWVWLPGAALPLQAGSAGALRCSAMTRKQKFDSDFCIICVF